jgi:hypothetical protein
MPFGLTTDTPGQRAPSIQGLWLPILANTYSEHFLVAVEAASESLVKEHTVQMTFVDHVSDPNNLTSTPEIMLGGQMSTIPRPGESSQMDSLSIQKLIQ